MPTRFYHESAPPHAAADRAEAGVVPCVHRVRHLAGGGLAIALPIHPGALVSLRHMIPRASRTCDARDRALLIAYGWSQTALEALLAYGDVEFVPGGGQ